MLDADAIIARAHAAANYAVPATLPVLDLPEAAARDVVAKKAPFVALNGAPPDGRVLVASGDYLYGTATFVTRLLAGSRTVVHAVTDAEAFAFPRRYTRGATQKAAASTKGFAGFADFDACVQAMASQGHYDEESARKICAKLQAAAEGKSPHPTQKRAIRAIVCDKRNDRSGAPLVGLAIGPVAAEAAAGWDRTVSLNGALYVALGKAAPCTGDLAIGDVVDAEVAGLLFTTGGPRSLRPTAIDVVAKCIAGVLPATLPEVIDAIYPAEIKKRAHFFDVHYGRAVAFKATEDEERFALGIVLEPDVEDSQGDIYTAKEIRTAAHYFMEHHATIGLMHRRVLDKEAKILESYVALADFTVNTEHVRAGTWLLGARFVDDALWAGVKAGNYTAWSIGAFALREELPPVEGLDLT